MAVKVSLSSIFPKLSYSNLSTHNSFSNGQLKFNPNFKTPISKLFLKSPKSYQTFKLQSHNNQINCLFTGIVEEMGKVKQLGTGDNGGFDLKIGAKTVIEDVKLGDSIAVNGTCLTVTEFNTELSEFTVGLAPETLRKTSLFELEPGSVVNLERALLPSTRMGGHFVQRGINPVRRTSPLLQVTRLATWTSSPVAALTHLPGNYNQLRSHNNTHNCLGRLNYLEHITWGDAKQVQNMYLGHVDGTGEIVSLDPENDSLWVKVKTSPELLKYIVPKGFITVDGASLTVVNVFDDELCFNFMLVSYTQQNVVIPLKKVGQKVNLEVDILGKYVERLLTSGFLDSVKSAKEERSTTP